MVARSLSQALSLSRHLSSISSTPSSPLVFLRAQSNHSSSSRNSVLTDLSESADPLLQKLEDAIDRIIVRRSAPDWLPFLPGESYWVPPPRSPSFGSPSLPVEEESISNNLSSSEDDEG